MRQASMDTGSQIMLRFKLEKYWINDQVMVEGDTMRLFHN